MMGREARTARQSPAPRASALPLSQQETGAPGGFEEIGCGADCGGFAGARHPKAGDARRRRRPHVGVAVADKHSLIRAKSQVAHRTLHHSRSRLARTHLAARLKHL